MKGFMLLALLIFFLSACAGTTVPFHQAAPAVIQDRDVPTVAERFKGSVPDDFHLLSSIVFEYNHLFTVSGLGYVDINRDGRYKVACMNHMAVKLFEFEGDRNGMSHQYAIEPLARQGNVVAVVGDDIKRIYLDLTPASSARIIRRGGNVVYRQRSGDGALEYEFGGEGGNLLSKTYREDQRAVWRVSYYEYQRKNDKLYPGGIILTNFRYGYRLIVRQKEILG